MTAAFRRCIYIYLLAYLRLLTESIGGCERCRAVEAGACDVIGRRPMMDLLIDVCARGRLNPATHALVVPSDGTGTVPFTASQSVQSLGVSTVRVVAKSQTLKPDQRLSGTTSSQPFEVHHHRHHHHHHLLLHYHPSWRRLLDNSRIRQLADWTTR